MSLSRVVLPCVRNKGSIGPTTLAGDQLDLISNAQTQCKSKESTDPVKSQDQEREAKVKFARMVGLVAIAAVALTAMLGTASALAEETVLCSSVKVSPYCKTSDRYPTNTAISASTTLVTINTSVTTVTCGESTLTGKTSAETGEPLPMSFSAWTLGSCTYGAEKKSCTSTSVEAAPYSGTLSRTTHNDGTLNIKSGGSGNPGWAIKCGALLNCTWSIEPGLTLHGEGIPASISGKEVPLTRVKGFCPTPATFTASYAVNGLPLVAPAAPKEPPASAVTGLCKEAAEWCEPAYLYSSGTGLKGTASNVVFDTPEGYPLGDLSCESSSSVATPTASYGEPLPMELNSFGFSVCHFGTSNGMSCVMTSDFHDESGGLSRGTEAGGSWSGDGFWTGEGLEGTAHMKCGAILNCTYTIASGGANIEILHGEPGEIKVSEVGLTSTGGVCPSSALLSGDYLLTGPLVVTDVFR